MYFVLSERVMKSSPNLKTSLNCAFKHIGCKISAQVPARDSLLNNLFAQAHKKCGFISPQKQGANPGGMREEECGKVSKAENPYLMQGCFEII